MYPLFETVCIKNGTILNGTYHESRFMHSYQHHFHNAPDFSIFDTVHLTELHPKKTYKLKIMYGKQDAVWTVSEYHNTIPTTLKVVMDDHIAYGLKFLDRASLESLFDQRASFDDVLIIKNNLVTDASYANILFKKGTEISTPKTPLLRGTCRARSIVEHTIVEKDIPVLEIPRFTHFQLINAMNDYDPYRWISTKNIAL